MNEFSKLKDVSKLITKGTTPTSVGGGFTDKGINFIKSESITESKFLNNSVFAFIDENTDLKLKRSRIETNDLLFSIAGAYLGKISIVREGDVPANTNQAVGIVRIDKSLADVNYLYYYFSQNNVNEYINKLSSQSSQPNLNLELLGKLQFKSRKLESQKKIAAVLSALDEKIELNNQLNAQLEQMAKTIYDYWFVQFDFPDENGKPYKSFGGKMVFNEVLKRKIPENWSNTNIGKISKLIRGVSYGKDDILKNNSEKNTIKILRATNLSGNKIDLNNPVIVCDKLANEQQILNKYDILITMSSGSIDHIGKNGMYYFDEVVAFGAFCAKLVANEKYNFYLYSYMQSPYLKTTIKNECLGTNINNLNGSIVNEFKIVLPDLKTLLNFNIKVEDIYKKIGNNEKQNQELAQLRDWLLPMLMNGQVRVGSGEYEMEEGGLGMAAEDEGKYENSLSEQEKRNFLHSKMKNSL